MPRSYPSTPVVMVKVAKKVGAPSFAAIVCNGAAGSSREHQQADSGNQQGFVHLDLLGLFRIFPTPFPHSPPQGSDMRRYALRI